jgi:DNA polymerase IV
MRSVLFIDPPAFCTTLEGMAAPALRTRPLAIAPPAADRSTILALSAEARLAGLMPGMPVRKAQQLCPDLIVLPPNPELYARASRALHDILRVFAPTIEPRGYGHAYLDLTGTDRLFGPPQDVAARIWREAHDRLRLPVSVGIAVNKLVSQAAIRADRRTGGRADGWSSGRGTELLQVASGHEREFLAPHPLEVLPELDPVIRTRLEDYQLEVIGEVAAISESALCAVFGRHGRILRARARGIDPRPVLSPEQQSEFRVAHTFASDTNDLEVLHPMLRLMTERLGRRLRRRELTAGRLRLEVSYADYTTAARAVLIRAAVLDSELWDAARRALALATSKRLAIRSIAVTLDRLAEPEEQLDLWAGQMGSGAAGQEETGHERTKQKEHTDILLLSRGDGPAAPPPHRPAALQHAIDHIRARYGAGALQGSPLTAYCSPLTTHQTTTTFPKVVLPSRTRWASASSVIG